MAERKSMLRATMVVGGAMLVSRILGFLRNSAIAFLFGQSRVVDAYNVAFSGPDTLYLILIGGGISSAFIPVLARYLADGKTKEAWRVSSIAFNVVLVGMGLIVALGWLTAPLYVRLLAPYFSPQALALTVSLTRITIIAILFHSLNGVLIGTEYAHNSFIGTAIGPLVYNIAIVAFGVWLAPHLGIAAFAWSTVIGAFLNFLVQVWGVLILRPRYTWGLNVMHPGIRRIGALMLPVMIGLSVAQINLLINQSFLASALPGGTINALVLASRVMLVPVMFATSIGITLLPSLTRQIVAKDRSGFRQSFGRALRLVLFISVPATVGLIVLAQPVVRILFEHGRFALRDTLITANALQFYAVGVLGYAAYEVLSRAFYAVEDTRTPLRTGIISMLIGVVLNFALVHVLSYRGLALGYSLTGFINAVLLLLALRRRMGALGLRGIVASLARTVLASAVMAVAVLYTVAPLQRSFEGLQPHVVGEIAEVLAPIVVGAVVFFGMAVLLRIEELIWVLRTIAARRARAA